MVRIDVKAVTEQVTNSSKNNNNVVVVQNICVDRSWNRDRFCGILLTIITTKVPPNQVSYLVAFDDTLFEYPHPNGVGCWKNKKIYTSRIAGKSIEQPTRPRFSFFRR